jgi:alpha-L-rhamnosidase
MTRLRVLSCFFVMPLALFVNSLLLSTPSLLADAGAPTNLLCESMQNPLGIGIVTPRFSWWLQDDRRGAKQTAFQILVASSPEALKNEAADVWDSGKVQAADSVNVSYGGPKLKSRLRYYWQVRVWDQNAQASPYSAASWWEMGLLATEDWKANWISRNDELAREDVDGE